MADTRRNFLAKGSLGLLGAAIAGDSALTLAQAPPAGAQTGTQTGAPAAPSTPGAPPAFGTAPPAGPAVTPETLREAEKLVRVAYTEPELAEAAGNWQQAMAPLYERRTGPRKLELGYDDAPATVWNPEMKPFGQASTGVVGAFQPTRGSSGPLPQRDEDIAFSTVVELSAWIRERKLTSERLTRIYLERLKRFQPKLNCVITLTEQHALEQARAADAEIAAGKYRGPLHGIPWGAKDLLDTAGIRTTWGAEPFRNRVPAKDAAVTARLNAAGAVLVAKLSLGALALNDVWFGAKQRIPGSWRRARPAPVPARGPL